MSPDQNPATRDERRYQLRLPVRLAANGDGNPVFYALSENISFHGILLRMEKMVAAGTSVSLSVEIPSRFRKRHLSASGTVVRIIKLGDQSYELAVSCRQRPFVRQDLNLPSDS